MTKKHFESLALHLAEIRPAIVRMDGSVTVTNPARDAWDASVGAVADACALASPRFDRERFTHACETYVTAIRDGRLVKVSR